MWSKQEELGISTCPAQLFRLRYPGIYGTSWTQWCVLPRESPLCSNCGGLTSESQHWILLDSLLLRLRFVNMNGQACKCIVLSMLGRKRVREI